MKSLVCQTFIHEAVIGRLFGALKTLARSQPVAKAEEAKSEDDSDASGTTLEAKAWAVVGQLSTNPSFWKRVHNYDFDFMCSRFGKVGGAASLRILSILNDYMKLVEANDAPSELLTSQCLSDIRSGVLHFLRSKWPHQERDECLRLVYQLMQQAGTSWMVPGTTLRSQAPPEEVSGGKFVLFLLKLVSIEVRAKLEVHSLKKIELVLTLLSLQIKLILDEVELALVQMEEAKIEEAGEVKRRGREIERALQVLPVCYGVVEQVISGLVSSDVDSLVLPYEALLQMKNTFADTFAVVLEFMTLASEYTQTHRYRGLKEAQDPSVLKLDAVICASVRVVGAWIAEDSDTSVDVVIKVLPFMICYTPLSTTVGTEEAEATGGNQDDVDSDDELDSDDEVDALAGMIKSVNGTEEQDQHVDQLHFLLPGLLQISALPEGAAALSEDNEVLRRLMRFTCTLCAEIADGTSEFGGISTMTLCLGVLINLILVRGGDGAEASSAGLPNAVEWFRSLAFLLPVACASGSRLINDSELTMEARGEDDRYVMLLHVVCVVLFIASHFQDPNRHPTKLSESATRLVAPFNAIVEWILSHPPAVDAESTLDLFELVRVLSMRSLLTPQLLSR
jgi:hypothetical protein